MQPQVCVQCNNNKTINGTDNRLVTESCGHMKCMDCLLREKAGCVACSLKTTDGNDNTYSNTERKPQPGNPVRAEKDSDTSHITINTDDKGKYYLCTKCNRKWRSRQQQVYHMYCNGRQKPFQCSVAGCGKSFVSRSHYKYHMLVHGENKVYTCDTCGRGFYHKSKLARHMTQHTQDKRYTCNVCKKAFSSISSLRQHNMIHTKEKPYRCKVCQKMFRDRSNLYKHIMKHDKKIVARRDGYRCPRCDQVFQTTNEVRRHSTIHLESKPYRCKICTNKSFGRKDNLERHIRTSHPTSDLSSAMDIDEQALAETKDLAKKAASERSELSRKTKKDREYLVKEKSKLASLNPLPPLSQEIIEKHMSEPVQRTVTTDKVSAECDTPVETIDITDIMEANTARESVIFFPKNLKLCELAKETKDYGYIHKIRKANSMANKKDLKLPPIDVGKILELQGKTSNNLDVGSPPTDVEWYKKIICDKFEKDADKDRGDSNADMEEHTLQGPPSPKHWRSKLKLNVTCWSDV